MFSAFFFFPENPSEAKVDAITVPLFLHSYVSVTYKPAKEDYQALCKES
jgi:hypothetical protein